MKLAVAPAATVALAGDTVPPACAVAVTRWVVGLGVGVGVLALPPSSTAATCDEHTREQRNDGDAH